MEMHERVSKLEVKVEELEHNQSTIESHLKKVRDNMNEQIYLIQDLRIVVAELKVVSENQNKILDELKKSREYDNAKREDDKKWLIRLIGSVIITALLGLII